MTLFTSWRALVVLGIRLLTLVVVFGDLAFAAATADIIEAFRYTYGIDRLLYLASQEIVMWRFLERRKKPVGGRGQWILPVQTKNTGVWVGHAEGGAKTTRRAQPDMAEASFSLQEFHGIWDVSWKLLQDARKDEYAFARAVDFMDAAFRRRVFRLLNCDFCGDGLGRLATLPAADNDTVITIRSLPFNDLGLIIDIMDETDHNTKLAAARTTDAIDIKGRTVTISGAAIAGSAAGDYFTVADSVSTTASLHTLGILAWADDANPAAPVGNIGGINRTTAGNEYFEGNVLDNAGVARPLTEDLLIQMADLTRERGGIAADFWLSNLPIVRRYHESLRADVFYALGAVKPLPAGSGLGRTEDAMERGEKGMGRTPYEFSGTPWYAEPFFDANRIVCGSSEHLYIGHGENEVPRPLSEIFDDMVPFFTATVNTTFEVISYGQFELLCDNPPSLGVIEDIAES